jgi:hypothetical protein
VDVLGTSADYLIGITQKPFLDLTKNLDKTIYSYLDHPVHGAFLREYLNAPDQIKDQTRQFLKFIIEQSRTHKA